MRRRWTEAEYAQLFGRFPPDGRHPTQAEAALLAREFDRTVDAIEWQWEDGAAYVQGRAASTTSHALQDWLDNARGTSSHD